MAGNEPCHLVNAEDHEGQTVTVPIPLSTAAEEASEFLRGAEVHYRVWLDVALFYRTHGKMDAYTDVLDAAVVEMGKKLAENDLDRDRRCELLCSLAGHHLNLYAEDSGSQESVNNFTRLLEAARGLVPQHPEIAILQALRHLLGVYYSTETPDEKKAKYEKVARRLMLLKGKAKTTTQQVQVSMGLAITRYFMDDFVAAWKDFADLMYVTPGKTPHMVRLGLGYCNFKLGQTAGAIKAFERAVEGMPDERRSLLGLVSILMSYQGPEADAIEKQKAASEYLVNAFRKNPDDLVVLNLFATYLFRELYAKRDGADPGIADNIKKVTKKVQRLAESKMKELKKDDRKTSVEYARAKETLAEASFQHGRLAQLQGKFSTAADEYGTCVKNNPKHIPALFNFAQCLIKNKLVNTDEAVPIAHVDEVLDLLLRCSNLAPENADLLSVVSKLNVWKGITVVEPTVREKAFEVAMAALHKITEVADPLDPEAWMLRGYVDRSDIGESLRCLLRQVDVLGQLGKPVSALLYSNVAALQIEARLINDARATLAHADSAYRAELAADPTLAGGDEHESVRSTIMYNNALCDELERNFEAAAAQLRDIIKQTPDFVDAYQALADIYFAMGQCKLAVKVAEVGCKVLGEHPLEKRMVPRLHLAELLYRMNLLRESINAAKAVAEELELAAPPGSTGRGEALRELVLFAKMIEANGRYAMSASGARLPSDTKRHELERAQGLFKEIHEEDPDNAFAVHNIACSTASLCHFVKQRSGEMRPVHQAVSKALIERVKEADVPSGHALDAVATYNLAQLYAYQRHPTLAIPLFLSLMAKAEANPQLRSTLPLDALPGKLAHCQALKRDFRASVRTFSKLVEDRPSSLSTTSNMAMATLASVLQDFNDDKLATLESVDGALGQLRTVKSYMLRLITEVKDGEREGTLNEKAKQRLKNQLPALHDKLAKCDEAIKLIEEEGEGMKRTISYVHKSVEMFKSNADELVGLKEQQRAQEEAERRRRQEEEQQRMEAQEQQLAAMNERYEENMRLRKAAGVTPAQQQGRGVGRKKSAMQKDDLRHGELDAALGGRSYDDVPELLPDDGGDDDAFAQLGRELLEQEEGYKQAEQGSSQPAAAAAGRPKRKRVTKEVSADVLKQIAEMEQESDYTDEFIDDDDAGSDFSGSIGSDDTEDRPKKKRKVSGAAGKKEKKKKKEKKEKKEKKGKKEKGGDDEDDLMADF